MKKITYYCDSCGKEIIGLPVAFGVHCTVRENPEKWADKYDDWMQELNRQEFCEVCAKAAVETLKPCRRQQDTEDEEIKKAIHNVCQMEEIDVKSLRQPRYDYPKIEALKNAGWGWEEIRQEIDPMQESKDAIRNAFYYWKKKNK